MYYTPYNASGNKSISASKISFAEAPVLYKPNVNELNLFEQPAAKQNTSNFRYELDASATTGGNYIEPKVKFYTAGTDLPNETKIESYHVPKRAGQGSYYFNRDRYQKPKWLSLSDKKEHYTTNNSIIGLIIFLMFFGLIVGFMVLAFKRPELFVKRKRVEYY